MWYAKASNRVPTRKVYAPRDKRVLPVELVVIHYTAGPDRPMRPRVERWAQQPTEVNDASTHIVVSRDPRTQPTLQLAPFNARTWHAGGSVWRGSKNINARSIGLDVDNVGRLKRVNGVWFDTYGNRYKGPSPFIDERGNGWEPYTEESITELCTVLALVCDLFPVFDRAPERIVGHEDIKSTKQDPGRAFDQWWPLLRAVTQ